MRNQLLAAIVVILAIATISNAQNQHPNLQRGFTPNRAYDSLDIDSINTFNGNLVLNVPLGKPFKVGGDLSYAFNLNYNSFIWSNETQCNSGSSAVNVNYSFTSFITLHRSTYFSSCLIFIPGFPGVVPWFCESEGTSVSQTPVLDLNGTLQVPTHIPGERDCYSMTTINPASNAGVGWQLSFGKLFRPSGDVTVVQPNFAGKLSETYQSPDGREHHFYKTLHEGESDTSTDEEPDLFYTRDGSYIRMLRSRDVQGGVYGGFSYTYVLYFPNGEKHYFQRLRARNAEMTEFGVRYGIPFDEDKLVKIVDQHGNWVKFDYEDDSSDSDDNDGDGRNIEIKDNVMRVTDSVGREHVVKLVKPNPYTTTLIKTVSLETSNNYKTQYTLRYGEILQSPLERTDKEFTDASDGDEKSGDNFETTTLIASPHAKAGDIPGYNTGAEQPNEDMREKIKVPYLTSIQLPHGMRYSMPIAGPGQDQADSYYQPLEEGVQRLAPGALRRITLPTGAEIAWDYGVKCAEGVPTNQCDVDPGQTAPNGVDKQRYGYFYSSAFSGRAAARIAPGVRRRHLIFKRWNDRTEVIQEERHTWKYDPLIGKYPPGCNPTYPSDPCGPPHIVNRVTTPQNDVTKYYYSIYPHPQGLAAYGGRGETERHAADYGLPFTKDAAIDQAENKSDRNGKRLFLSTETIGRDGQRKRATYVRFDMDQFIRTDGFANSSDTNQRLAASSTYYYDDGPNVFDEVIYSDFNGLGHYRKAERYSNIGNPSAEPHYSSVTTNYIRGGSFNVNPQTNIPSLGFVSIPLSDPWITGLFDHVITRDRRKTETNSTAIREDFAFQTNGLLDSKRVYAAIAGQNQEPAPSNNDVVVNYVYSANGNLTSEEFRGGGRQDLSSNPGYEYKKIYEYPSCPGGGELGIPRTERFEGSGFLTVDNDIDCKTGLIKASRDTAGFTTQYFYDDLGRITNIYLGTSNTPAQYQGGSVKVRYQDVPNGSPFDDPEVFVEQYETRQQTGVGPITLHEFDYDKLGRLTAERVKMPDGSVSVRSTRLNELGWKLNETEWLAESLWQNCDQNNECQKRTEYHDFDTFGRPGRIVLPGNNGNLDDKVVRMEYRGIREVYERKKVASSISSDGATVTPQDSERWEHYDHLGRLLNVEEKSGAGTSKVPTDYAYNVLNKLTGMCSGSVVRQCRTFRHDARGNLLKEVHPERATTEYTDFDTLGNVGITFDGINRLTYNYDPAGRETVVQTPAGRKLRESFYFTGNGGAGGEFSKGKLERAVRYNYVANPYVTPQPGQEPTILEIGVREHYVYSGVTGKLSARVVDTTIPGSINPRFYQTFGYDKLGNLKAQSYPECTTPNCANYGQRRPWTVNYKYDRNMLTNVGGGSGVANTNPGTYVSAISYNINQTVGAIKHSNNVLDTATIDPNNVQRVGSISWDRVATNGELTNIGATGPYQYDGAGNISRIGQDWFLYDRVNRLKAGTALKGATPSTRLKQEFDYDEFGNVTTLRTYNNVTAAAVTLKETHDMGVSSATNRLNVNYDVAGNVLGLAGQPPTYKYDELNMISTAPNLTYLYGPNDERLWIIDTKGTADNSDNEETFTLRGLSNEVLREYKTYGGNEPNRWAWHKDYVYGMGRLIAAETREGRRHYHVDHLGSVRLVTNHPDLSTTQAEVVERTKYLPFGQTSGFYNGTEYWSLTEATAGESPSRLGFTGHEKDTDVFGLTYMHARFYLEKGGKFLSIDPGRDIDADHPQSWNLYSYVRNNPLNSVDRTGMTAVGPYSDEIRRMANDKSFWGQVKYAWWQSSILPGPTAIHAAASTTIVGTTGRAAVPAFERLAQGAKPIRLPNNLIVRLNNYVGGLAESFVARLLQARGMEVLGSQVSVRVPGLGVRVIDVVARTSSGQIVAFEVKSGAAVRSLLQVMKDARMETVGARITANAPHGMRVGQTLQVPTHLIRVR